MSRLIVIGDIHGCLDEMDSLLAKVSFNPGTDRLVLAGDLVDRGPDSHGVVRRAVELNALCVMGNHDEKHVRYRRYRQREEREPGFKSPMRPFSDDKEDVHDSLTDADIDYLEALPAFLRFGHDIIVVHGGLAPGRPEDQSPKQMIRRRYVDPATQKPVKLGRNHEVPEGARFWTDFWEGPELVIYGHHVHGLDWPQSTYTGPSTNLITLGLDTGACFGGKLSAVVIERGVGVEIAQVQSKEYFKSWNTTT